MFDKYIEKFKSLSKGKKIIVVLVLLGLFGYVIDNGGSKPNMDPCDCYELFKKEELVGFKNLQKLNKYRYNDCVKVWDNSRKANDGCMKKYTD